MIIDGWIIIFSQIILRVIEYVYVAIKGNYLLVLSKSFDLFILSICVAEEWISRALGNVNVSLFIHSAYDGGVEVDRNPGQPM